MSARKRMSLGGLRGRSSPANAGSGAGSKSSRRSSIGAWASGIGGALASVQSKLQQASAAADRFERRLFAEYDDDYGEVDDYGALYAQRGHGQRAEFESR